MPNVGLLFVGICFCIIFRVQTKIIINKNAKQDSYLDVTAYQVLNALYVDGIQQVLSNDATWDIADTLPLNPDDRLVALVAVNFGDLSCSGVLASVTDNYLLTNRTWKCNNGLVGPDWMYLGYDDSFWQTATEYGNNGDNLTGCSTDRYVPEISENAHWIWTDNSNDLVAYCRGYLPLCETASPCLNNGRCISNDIILCQCLPRYTGRYCEADMLSNPTLAITAKSTLFDLYIDGIGQILNNGNNWNEVDIIPLNSYNRVIGATAIDISETCPGLLASVNGDFLETDFTWKCVFGIPQNWYTLGFDDSEWSDAFMIGRNGDVVSPEQCTILTEIPEISPNAYWIWTPTLPDNYDPVVSCRGYLPVCERLSPCQNGGTCNRNSVDLCSCLPFYSGVFCENAVTLERNLTVTAKTLLSSLYIDGAIQSLINNGEWTEVDVLPLQPLNRLIALQALDLTFSCGGVLASVTFDDLLTDATWKCSSTNPPNWFNLGFDDSSWSDAYPIGPNGNVVTPESCNILTGISAISPNAYWIWTPSIQNAPNYDPVIACRAYLPLCERVSLCQNGGTCNKNEVVFCSCLPGYTGFYCELIMPLSTLAITAKSNLFNLYIDGAEKYLSCGSNAACTDDIAIYALDRLVAVKAGDITQTCAGILASATGDYLLTDAQWKCHASPPPYWYLLGYDDSSWTNAYVIGPNYNVTFPDACQILAGNPSVSPDASWIWTPTISDTPNYDQTIYCRAYLGLCELNSPCENGGTCNQNDVAICTCPSEYTGVFCEIAKKRSLTIATKTYLWQLYVDGVKENVSTFCASNWTVPVDVELGQDSRLIAVRALDERDMCAGILASVTGDFLLSDATWRCSNSDSPGWYQLGFDDSQSPWTDAYVIGPNGNVTLPARCEILTGISSISPNANWIWYPDIVDSPMYSDEIFCRAYLPTCERESPCQNGGSCNRNSPDICTCLVGYVGKYCENNETIYVTLTAEQTINSAYIDGNEVDVGNSGDSSYTDTYEVWSISRLIAISALQPTTDCPGILVSVANITGSDFFVTDETWKCSGSISPGWFDLGFDDSFWENATLIKQNIDSGDLACPNLPLIFNISPDAYWIWASTYTSVYCRGYIPLCERNPCKFGTCNRNSADLCTCDSGYGGLHCDQVKEIYLTITVNQTMNLLYTDGIQQSNIPNSGNVDVTDNLLLLPTNTLVAVMGVSVGGSNCPGILASVTDDYLLTDNGWKCSSTIEADWFSLDFNDTDWENATSYGRDRPGCDDVSDVDEKAEWIWTSLTFNPVVYCRGYLTEPEPLPERKATKSVLADDKTISKHDSG